MTNEESTPGGRAEGGAKTLDNGLRVLKQVAAQPDGLSMTEIARAVGIHRTVAYRLLLTLGQHALVAQGDDGRFRLGVGVLELSSALRSDLQSAARPHMQRLADTLGATVHLTVLDDQDAISIAMVEPRDSQMHVTYRVGRRYPVTVGAAGMAILAGRPAQPGERAAVTAGRDLGYVASEGEIQPGAWGLAAPIRHRGRDATVSVGVVAMGPGNEEETARLVLAAARDIAQSLVD